MDHGDNIYKQSTTSYENGDENKETAERIDVSTHRDHKHSKESFRRLDISTVVRGYAKEHFTTKQENDSNTELHFVQTQQVSTSERTHTRMGTYPKKQILTPDVRYLSLSHVITSYENYTSAPAMLGLKITSRLCKLSTERKTCTTSATDQRLRSTANISDTSCSKTYENVHVSYLEKKFGLRIPKDDHEYPGLIGELIEHEDSQGSPYISQGTAR
ncbi:hypothetical protein BJ508DRAFT_307001 [Ascobolus immersus RN42]|uniref:Uncharacterized protein n=1 Tax=Ascobolus immersus RN42 TaxID=1160509 RepID=A0A3N4I4N5_ASCIM|nr:hypothetical protein BJ508DRAFT_307001 [Ascobolus immersus RN42]